MSVIVTVRVAGDPALLEQYAAANPGNIRAISDHAEEHGLIAHRFYGGEDGILVVDEWPDRESFDHFFEHAQPEIQQIFEATGITSAPEVSSWRKLETHDEVGWK